MDVYVEREKQRMNIDFHGSASQLLSRIGVSPEEVIIVCNGKLITEEDALKQDDSVELLSVISGG